ncbi:MAG: response regulator [Oscillospiraceae bacterium]|nr:response regulator [Oscillospiraceae bacterium]
MESNNNQNTLLYQLECLLKASQAGDYDISLNADDLSPGDAKTIETINTALDNYRKSLEETKSASDAKSEFLANMSHEMRTPLNAILGLTGLCLEVNTPDDELKNNLENVYKAGATLLEMVNDILDIAQIEDLDSYKSFDARNSEYVKPQRISLPYARVLVVDDNLTNLDVARGLLKPYKMKIDCVDSGEKAIDAMRFGLNKYDAIFMDQMMPGMDGIEAAEKIRALGSDYSKNIPVIALTANAVAGNEKMFLDRGFQAFITKPIDIKKLDDAIMKWIRNIDKEAFYNGMGGSEIKNPEFLTPLLGKVIGGLNTVKGVKQFGGDVESYLKVLRSFAVNTRTVLASLGSFKEDMVRDYEITVHGVKGSSSSICADDISALAKTLEIAAKENDIKFIKDNNQFLVKTTEKLITELDSLFSEIDSKNPKPEMDRPDDALLLRLKNACVAYDMDGVDTVMDEIAKYNYRADDGLVSWLSVNIEQMNFSEIVERLSLG